MGASKARKCSVLLDLYHHRAAQHWIGGQVVTGKMHNNLGRYGLEDNYHTNGYFNLTYILADQCHLREHFAPITSEVLGSCDILVVVNPDYPGYPGHAPPFEEPEIAAIHDYVARGGGLLLMINSFLPEDTEYLWKENYDLEAANRILQPYGLAGGHHVSQDSEICPIAGDDLDFGDLGAVEYGHGGQIHITPVPGVSQRVHFGNGGKHYCVSARGQGGLVVALADAGFMSNGLVTAPWAANLAFTQRLFRALAPHWLSEDWTPVYSLSEFRTVAYPHAAGLGPEQFKQLNPCLEPQEAYNYHYLYRHTQVEIAGIPAGTPVDALRLAEAGCASAVVDLLSCELEGSGCKIEIPIEVVASTVHGDWWDVEVVGAAALPRVSLAACCRKQLPAFAEAVIRGGVQSLKWRYRIDRRANRLMHSVAKSFAEPAWLDGSGSVACVNLAWTQVISPRVRL